MQNKVSIQIEPSTVKHHVYESLYIEPKQMLLLVQNTYISLDKLPKPATRLDARWGTIFVNLKSNLALIPLWQLLSTFCDESNFVNVNPEYLSQEL